MNMETNDLINILAQAPQPKRPLRLGLLAAVIAILSASVTIATLGLRPELIAGQPPASFWIKTALLSVMALVSLRELSRSSKPIAQPRMPWLALLLAIAATALGVHEWLTVDSSKILGGFLSINFRACLVAVTIYGGLGMAGFTVLMRRYAPANTKQCAGFIGLAAAAAGAVGYSIHCPFDSPTFIVVAYGLPMAALWAIGRRVLPNKLNW